MEARTFKRELPVTLSERELQTYGGMLAAKIREEEALEDRKKQKNNEFGTQIKAVRQEIKRIADCRAKGEELRPVECVEEWKNGVIEIRRLDTNQVVDVRPATMMDAQVEFPIDDGPRGAELDSEDDDGDEGAMTGALPARQTQVDNGSAWPDETLPPAPVTDDDGAPVGELVQSSTGADVYISGGEVEEPIASEGIRVFHVDNETGASTELTATIGETSKAKGKGKSAKSRKARK